LKKDAGKPGIWVTRHLYSTAPVIKKKWVVGKTHFTPKEVQDVVKQWSTSDWRVDDYHLLAKNCNHFADTFLQKLAERGEASPGEALSTVPTSTPTAPPTTPPLRAVTPPTPSNRIIVPGGVSSLPRFPDATFPTFPLTPQELSRLQECFKLPSWVNRAASVGNKVIPEFIFKKILEALMPPVPEEEEDDDGDDQDSVVKSASSHAPLAQSSSSGGGEPPAIKLPPKVAEQSDRVEASSLATSAVAPPVPDVLLQMVDSLREVIGNVDDDVSQQLLSRSRWNVELAINLYLSDMSAQ
jgi:hypothetical protein